MRCRFLLVTDVRLSADAIRPPLQPARGWSRGLSAGRSPTTSVERGPRRSRPSTGPREAGAAGIGGGLRGWLPSSTRDATPVVALGRHNGTASPSRIVSRRLASDQTDAPAARINGVWLV